MGRLQMKGYTAAKSFYSPYKDIEANVGLKKKHSIKHVDFTFLGYVLRTQDLLSSFDLITSIHVTTAMQLKGQNHGLEKVPKLGTQNPI